MNSINVNIAQVNQQPQVDQDPGMTLANYVFTIS